jgi:hypothetical protein
MILKEKIFKDTNSAIQKSGQHQERSVAFFLRRAYKDHPQIFVINDLKFSFNNETAQIDHLIVYPFGFILIESKSIKGEIKVNELGEWSRSLGDKWYGMPSPIKQVEQQQKLLRKMLHANRVNLLGKLIGLAQENFGGRCWNNVCVVSSDAIIHRESMPKPISEQLVKTEFLVDHLDHIMRIKDNYFKKLIFDSRPKFKDEELEAISSFLIAQAVDVNFNGSSVNKPSDIHKNISLKCKSCGSDEFEPHYGKYGYYINCARCDTNTSMKSACNSCGSNNTKVSKRKMHYFINCLDCETTQQII